MTLITNAVDANVLQTAPSANYGLTKVLALTAAGGGQERLSYIYFGRPFPLGVTILSATLRVYNTATWAGSVTLTAQRVAAAWSATKITYNNKPGVTGATAVVAKTGAAPNTEWAFDVTALMQTISDGAAWYGFRISTNNTSAKYLYSAQFGGSVVPTLEIVWSTAPQAPDTLAPSNNRAVSIDKPVLRFDFTDHSGSTQMQACQVQINATDVWTAPTFDSGTVATTIPQLDLTTTAYAGLAADTSTFWRVRVQDASGLWSAWSAGAQFQRKIKGTLTLNNPAVSPNNFVYDSTPPIDWTLTARTQKNYQVIISLASNTAKWLWDSGKVTAGTTMVTLPTGVLKQDDAIYNVRIRIWDTIDRETTPGDPAYIEISRDFLFNDDATVVPVTGLTGTPNSSYPWMQLDWSRATQPDKWEIVRDTKPILNDTAANYFVSGTSYRFTDKLADPRQNHTWTVYAVTNGKRSASPMSIVGQVKTVSTFICETDGTDGVLLLNPNNSPELREISAVHEVIGDAPPVLITQAIRGYEGNVSGIIADNTLPGRTARQQRDSIKKWRDQQGIPLVLYMIDEAFEVCAFNITYKSIAYSGSDVAYLVSFDFFQTDF